jgi:hypothetical protein
VRATAPRRTAALPLLLLLLLLPPHKQAGRARASDARARPTSTTNHQDRATTNNDLSSQAFTRQLPFSERPTENKTTPSCQA